MDPIEFATDFFRIMQESRSPIIAYELVSRSEEVSYASVLTTKSGLENLARRHSRPITSVRVDLHAMCIREHYTRAYREPVLSINMRTDKGYDFCAYAFND